MPDVTATNPQTGQKLKLNNGQWEPIQKVTATNPQTGEKLEFSNDAWKPTERPAVAPPPLETGRLDDEGFTARKQAIQTRAMELSQTLGAEHPETNKALDELKQIQLMERESEDARQLQREMASAEAIGRRGIIGLKGIVSTPTLGLSDVLFRKLEKESGSQINAESTTDQVAGAIGNLTGGLIAAHGFAGGLTKLATKFGLAEGKKMLAVRLGTAGIMSSRNVTQAVSGEKDPQQAAQDAAIQMVSSAAAMGPELAIKSGVVNWMGQVLTDFTVDFFADAKIRRRFQDVDFKTWFMTEELPAMAASVMFASRDLSDKNFELQRKRVVRELAIGSRKFANEKYAQLGARALADAYIELKGTPNGKQIVEDSLAQVNKNTQAGTNEDMGEFLREQAARLRENKAPQRELAPQADAQDAQFLNELNQTIKLNKAKNRKNKQQIKTFSDLASALEERAKQPDVTAETPVPPQKQPPMPLEATQAPQTIPEATLVRPDAVQPTEAPVAPARVDEVTAPTAAKEVKPEIVPAGEPIKTQLPPETEIAAKPKVKEAKAPVKETRGVTTMPDDITFDAKGEPIDSKTGKAVFNEKGGVNVDVVPPKPQEQITPENIRKKVEAKSKRGAISLPSEADIGRPENRVVRWVKKMASRAQGVDSKLYSAFNRMKARTEATKILGRNIEKQTNNLVTSVREKNIHTTDAEVRGDLAKILGGELTVDDFNLKYNAQSESEFLNRVQRMKGHIQNMLSKASNLSPAQQKKVKDNVYYQTREYERYILGENFEPKPEDYKNALRVVDDELTEKITKIAKVVSRATTAPAAPFSKERVIVADAQHYMETGDIESISHLSKNRQHALYVARKSYTKMNDLINSIDVDSKTGKVALESDSEAIQRAAKDIIDYELTKTGTGGSPIGGVRITNLRERTLDVLWRKLYGEITDPAYTAARTAEVQGRMLAEAVFWNKMAQEGKGKWWYERQAPGRKQLGSDNPRDAISRMRYGAMAGKWVDPNTYDLFHRDAVSAGMVGKVADSLYFQPQATMRMLKLINPKTMARNWATAYTGFAVGSGDAMLKGYHKRLAEGHVLLKDYVLKKPYAMAEMEKLVKNEVFSESLSTITQDIAKGGGKYTQKLGRYYAYIDFPTKYAAYKANMDNGMSGQDAIEHVKRLYQNRAAVPEGISKFSQVGLADYLGYTYDSFRISANQIKLAKQQALKGNIKPLMGFAASHGLQSLILYGKTAPTVAFAWAKLHQFIRREDKDVKETKVMRAEEEQALRSFMPSYYQNASFKGWEETNKNGEKIKHYVVLSGHSAWPMDDMLYSSLQSAQGGGGAAKTINTFVNFAEDKGSVGMFPNKLIETLWGEGIGETDRPGIFDLGKPENHSKRLKILAEATGKYVAGVYGGWAGDIATQSYNYLNQDAKEYRKRQEETGAYKRSMTLENIMMGKLALVRSYKVARGDLESATNRELKKVKKAMDSATRSEDPDGISYAITKARKLVMDARIVGKDWFKDSDIRALLKGAGYNAASINTILDSTIPYTPAEKQRRLKPLERIRMSE